ncbi:MAG: hypothetical protein LIO65_00055 [Odoribacter sp.]|nr:hypothetical protein [Odoribacter sp.]
MVRKLIIILCVLFWSNNLLLGQEFLNLSEKEIKNFIKQKTPDFSFPTSLSDSLHWSNLEEDEIGRWAEMEYTFIFKDGICIAYTKVYPTEKYWLECLEELIELKQGKKQGDELEIEGFDFSSLYNFENYTLHIKASNSKFYCNFKLNNGD